MINLISRLNNALSVIQLLSGAIPNSNAKMATNYSDIQTSFSKVIETLITDVRKYLKFGAEDH
jgi:hypothetical protein